VLAAAGALGWAELPLVDDLLAWSARGVSPGRTWVVSPSQAALRARWSRLIEAPPAEKATLFVERPGLRTIDSVVFDALPGYQAHATPMSGESRGAPIPVRYARRSFDRQWLIPDERVIDRPNVSLWRIHLAPGQIFLTSSATPAVGDGPAVTATALLPQFNHFNGQRGRAWPLWLDPDGAEPNVVDGVLRLLRTTLGTGVDALDLMAYITALTAHPGFTDRLAVEAPGAGLRVPVTASGPTFSRAVSLGRRILWLHTLGDRCDDHQYGSLTLADGDDGPHVGRSISHRAAARPDSFGYEARSRRLTIGDGWVENVEPQVFAYEVCGLRVVEQWLEARMPAAATARGRRRQSELDDVSADAWEAAWTAELLQVLQALTRLRELEPAQRGLLDEVSAGPLVPREELLTAAKEIGRIRRAVHGPLPPAPVRPSGTAEPGSPVARGDAPAGEPGDVAARA
jgi:hypothetical protein